MDVSLAKQRIEAALLQPQPAHALAPLARAFKEEGMTQIEMYRLFDEYRIQHEDDVDLTKWEAITDTMDGITGFCSGHGRLFDTYLTDMK